MMKPPMCLQYSIWALASYFNDKYKSYSEVFYQRARHYVDTDEMKVKTLMSSWRLYGISEADRTYRARESISLPFSMLRRTLFWPVSRPR